MYNDLKLRTRIILGIRGWIAESLHRFGANCRPWSCAPSPFRMPRIASVLRLGGQRVGLQRLTGAKHGAKSSLARTLLSLTVFYCCSTALIWALDPGRRISQYAHTTWRVQDGSINIGSSITQTPEGYLWLGTPEGLLRFDGPALTSQHLLIPTFWALATAVCGLERGSVSAG
jgi:hypothetical protein